MKAALQIRPLNTVMDTHERLCRLGLSHVDFLKPQEKQVLVKLPGGASRLFTLSLSEIAGLLGRRVLTKMWKPDEILRAAESRDAFLENVAVTKYPYMPDFKDIAKTGNARAIVTRDNLEIASKSLRAQRLHDIVILTRNPLVNVISRLTAEQATMQFIYGESIESSGGNPEEAGKFKREFFLDPFVAGDRLEHAMIFYDIVKRNRIPCYLANTGTIGPHDKKVTLRQSLAAYNDLARKQLRFSVDSDCMGHYYPIKCDRANLDQMRADLLFTDRHLMKKRLADFFRGRELYLESFEAKYGRIPKPIRESLPYHDPGNAVIEKMSGE